MRRKITIDFIKEQFDNEGYICLSNEYINNKTKLDYICPQNHKHSITWSDFNSGYRCPYCSGNLTSFDDVKHNIEIEGHTLLSSEYKNSSVKLLCLCPENHEYKISRKQWQRGTRCPKCYGSESVSWLDDLKDEIIKMVTCDYTQLEIANYFKVSVSSISTRLREWGANNPDGNRFTRKELNKEDLNRMYWKEEIHPSQIAKIYNCSTQTVVNNMKNYGIPLRTKSESRMGDLNPIYGVGHTDSAREKMSEAFVNGRTIGFNNHWGIGQYYDSPNQGTVWMRSGWEVKTADYLTDNDIDWLYEPETIRLTDLISYRPDFYILKEDYYIEVKGRLKEEDIIKMELFKNMGYKLKLWDAEELLKREIINNSGVTELNRKYRKEK